MHIRQRIKRLEQLTGVNDTNCKCGTPYFVSIVIGGENITRDVCPDCGRSIKPQTPAELALNAHLYEIEVIKPKAAFNRAEFEEWQQAHVISAHNSYEQYLEQENAG